MALTEKIIKSSGVAISLMRWILCGDFFATFFTIFEISVFEYFDFNEIFFAELKNRARCLSRSGSSLLLKVLIVSKMPYPLPIDPVAETLASFTNLLLCRTIICLCEYFHKGGSFVQCLFVFRLVFRV